MTGPTTESAGSALIGLLIVLGVRLIDYLLPTGHHLPHLPWVDDEEPEDEHDY